jgi:uncharacterized protein YndB with AHSA1/START domain
MSQRKSNLQIVRQLKHERARVFSALTDPVKMSQWFIGMKEGQSTVTNDLRPGGHYAVEMKHGAETHASHGAYLEIVPPEKLVFSWSGCGGGAVTTVTIELFEQGKGTKLVLTHELPESEIPGHREGWNNCLDHLEEFMAGKPAAVLAGKA